MKHILTIPRRSLHAGRIAQSQQWFVVAAVMVVAWFAGAAIAFGGTRAMLAFTLGAVAVGVSIVGALTRTRLAGDFAAIELPTLLILMGELVFRERDAQSLAANPLDPAGLYRVACMALALLLGSLALTSPLKRGLGRVTTRPFRLYCGYIFVVFIGAPLSVNLLLTAYRGVELAIGAVVLAGAYRRAGQDAMDRILILLYWFTAVSAIIIWIEAVIFPGSAFEPVADSPFPIQLHGLIPAVSANGTGTIGALLCLWSLGRILSPKDRGGARVRTLIVLGLVGLGTLIFAQYRTGYVIAAVGLLLLLALRAKAAAFWVLITGTCVAIVWGGSLAREAVPVLQRGATVETVTSLTGRLTYWTQAVPVWEESPLFGRGLLTASRYEVLAELGSAYTSTIHGTWVEALVGTGIVGVTLLAGAVLVTALRAFKEAIPDDGRIVPLLLTIILLVRSVTGPTFELAGNASIMLMAMMLLLRDTGSLAARTSRQGATMRAPP